MPSQKEKHKKMNEQEFCFVTRQKWIARRSLKYPKSLENISTGHGISECEILNFLRRLQSYRDRMESSDYFRQSLETLNKGFEHLGTGKINKIVCFGLGPFMRNHQALHQLSFLLELQRHLKIAEALFFDPVFQKCEKKVLREVGCTVMDVNCAAKYPADSTTFFYLPHVSYSLTNNLLWRNWTPELLTNAIIVNNSFKSLTSNIPRRLMQIDPDYVLDIIPYTREFVLEDCFKTLHVFNDLSLHVFPAEYLPVKESSFWAVRDAPVYGDEFDEMITVDKFSNLSLV